MRVDEVYQRRSEACAIDAARCARLSNQLSLGRGALFLVGVALAVEGWRSGLGGIWYYCAAAVAVAFLALIIWHDQVLQRLTRLQIRQQVNNLGLARIRRDWPALPVVPIDVPIEHQATSGDLDLFGPNSLFQLLCSPQTPDGKRTLRDWLIHPASPDTIVRRQQAIRQLGPQLDLREALQVEGMLLADRGAAVERFVRWAEGERWLARRRWLVWVSRLLPIALVVTFVLVATRQLPIDVGFWMLSGGLICNVLVTVFFAGRVHELFDHINRGGNQVGRYAAMFDFLCSLPDSANSTTELDEIKRRATGDGGGVRLGMRQLQPITRLANLQHSALFFIFVYIPLQFLILFDFHVLFLFEVWQRRHGSLVRGWFTALGEFEALAALAALHHDHPEWAFPTVNADSDRIIAKGLGHPLLSDARRICNDVTVGPRGTVLLVTGSNMSGKSTLLRALGLNATLAQAGATVSAQSLAMPPVVLATSIRIRDSLAAGVSFFMAELLRLKEIVDLARDVGPNPSSTLLYLLDEILLGTNSRERHIAVVRVLEYLLNKQAIGVITTHDLELATSDLLSSASKCVHFRETIQGPESAQPIMFDYLLRPGVATTTNALRLLKLVGLATPSSDE